MAALAKRVDIALPSRDVSGWAEELLNPSFVGRYARRYAALTGRIIGHQDQLIDAFFAHHDAPPIGGTTSRCNFVGFKLLPKQHWRFDELCQRGDLLFIVLGRRDAVSLLASMAVADRRNHWPRDGGPSPVRWRFGRSEHALVADKAREVGAALRALERVPAAVRISYETMCAPDFRCPALDALFDAPGQPSVRLHDPKPATDARRYVEHWAEFEAFARARLAEAGVVA